MKKNIIWCWFWFFLIGCKTIVVTWPDPDLLPKEIYGKQWIGQQHTFFSDWASRRSSTMSVPIFKEGTVYVKNKGNVKGNMWLDPIYIRQNRNMIIPMRLQLVTRPWDYITEKNIDSFFYNFGITNIDSVQLDCSLPDSLGKETYFHNLKSVYPFLNTTFQERDTGSVWNRVHNYFVPVLSPTKIGSLWRRLMDKEGYTIYDLCKPCNSYQSTVSIILITPKHKIKQIYDGGVWCNDPIKYNSYLKDRINKYIWKTYHINKNFNSITEMLIYIIEKEIQFSTAPSGGHVSRMP